MAQVITLAGERLFALKAQNNQQLDIDTFIFAFVPGQDSSAPIDRNEGLPPIGQRVHSQIVQQTGLINENAVVYSTVLDSLTGPFDFNWVGLYSSVNQTLIGIIHTPTVSKTVTVPGAAGNILNRNFVIEYSGIAELTGITVDAETWQLDYTARLNGMDELTRQLAADMNGKDWFIEDGFKVVPRSTLNTFKVTAGAGYVSGLRVELAADHILTLSSYPQFVYVDAWFDGTSESVWKGHTAFTVTNTEMDDYIDVNGRSHYVFKLVNITAADAVEDLRSYGLIEKIQEISDRWVSVIEQGADPTGVKPSGRFINETRAASKYILLPAGTYDVSDEEVDLGSDKFWFSYGATLKQGELENKKMLRGNNKGNFSVVGDLTLLGNATDEDITENNDIGEVGIHLTSCYGYTVDGLKCRRFKGTGISLDGENGAGDGGVGTFGERGKFVNIGVYTNLIGVELKSGNGAEYNSWTNLDGSKNRVGLKNNAGNNSFIGGGMSGNKYAGIILGEGVNDGHGRAVGMHVNHNGVYNLIADKVKNGFTFSACHFYGNALNSESGQIFLQNSKGISFEGGVIDCYVTDSDTQNVGGYNSISNVYMPGGYGDVKVKDLNGNRAKRILVKNCYGAGCNNINDAYDVHVIANRGLNGGQVVDLGIPTGIIFDTVIKDNRLSYYNDNGIFKCPKEMKGTYQIKGFIVVASTGQIDINTTNINLRKNTGIIRSFRTYSKGIAADGTDICKIDFKIDLYIEDDGEIQLEATVNGTGTPVIGSIFNLCELEIMKIS